MRARNVLAGMRRLPRIIIDSIVGLCVFRWRRRRCRGILQLLRRLRLFPGFGRGGLGCLGSFQLKLSRSRFRRLLFPPAFAELRTDFPWPAGDFAIFDPAGGSAQRSKGATTKSVPGRELPADTASLEVQAHTFSSFSRESDPPLAHAKTKTVRCRDPARSWPEVFLHQKASRPSRKFQLPRSWACGLSA